MEALKSVPSEFKCTHEEGSPGSHTQIFKLSNVTPDLLDAAITEANKQSKRTCSVGMQH